jgi:hypothetical protein
VTRQPAIEPYLADVSLYWRSAFFKEPSEYVVGVLVDAFGRVPSPMSGMVIEHFHGPVTRIDPTATAYPHREPGYNLVLTGEWLDPTEDGGTRTDQRHGAGVLGQQQIG